MTTARPERREICLSWWKQDEVDHPKVKLMKLLDQNVDSDSNSVADALPTESLDKTAIVRLIEEKDMPDLSLDQLARKYSRRGLDVSSSFVNTLSEALQENPELMKTISTCTSSLIKRARLFASTRLAGRVTSHKLIEFLVSPTVTHDDTLATKRRYLLEWMGEGARAAGLTDDGFFEDVVLDMSLISPSTVAKLAAECCLSNRLATLRICVISALRPDEMRCLGPESISALFCVICNSLEMIARMNLHIARHALSILCDIKTVINEDPFEMSTPVRLRQKVESWRRVGEKMRTMHVRSSLSQRNSRDSRLSTELARNVWLAGLRNELALNTAAACLGAILGPRTFLSTKAREVITQPDKDGLVPVAFITALLKTLTRMLVTQDDTEFKECLQLATALAMAWETVPTFEWEQSFNGVPSEVIAMLRENLHDRKGAESILFVESATKDKVADELSGLLVDILLELFRRPATRVVTAELRNILYASTVQRRSENNHRQLDELGCVLAQIVSGTRDNVTRAMGESQNGVSKSENILLEEHWAIAHLSRSLAASPCPKCSQGPPHHTPIAVETMFHLHVQCTYSLQSLRLISRTLRLPTTSPVIMQLKSAGAGPRVCNLVKDICERYREGPVLDATTANEILEVLHLLIRLNAMARSAVIEGLPWSNLLNHASRDSLIDGSLRSKILSLLHHLTTTASLTTASTSGNFQAKNTFFLAKKDDVVFVNVDRKHDLVSLLLNESFMSSDLITSKQCLETTTRLIEMYRSVSFASVPAEDLKRRCVPHILMMINRVEDQLAIVSENEALREAFSRFLTSAVQICPLIHALTKYAKDESPESICIKRAVGACARLASKQIEAKLLQAFLI